MLNSQKGGLTIILLFIVILILVGGGAYYFGTQNKTAQVVIPAASEQPIQPQPSITPAQSPSSKISSLPQGWTYQKSTACNVSIPIPPKAEPYTTTTFPPGGAADDNNRYWQFSENTESEMFFFKDDALVFFNPVNFNGLGNDYNPGSVSVFCAPNPDNLNSAQLVAKLEQEVKTKASDFKVANKGQANKWGKNAYIVNIEGGMYAQTDSYIFSAGDKAYFVRSVSNSENQPVKDTTKQIFDNLQFSN